MTRFLRRTHPLLHVAIGLCVAGLFALDLSTELGISVWVLYVIPVSLTLWAWRPRLPLLVAAACTALVVAGYLLDRSGAFPAWIARLNRAMGVATIWAVGLVARQFILTRLRLAEEDWLRVAQRDLRARLEGELSLEKLADNVLRFLCPYLDAPVGLFYAVDESGRLQRKGAYAVSRLDAPELVEPGEGLLGQAARENRMLRLDGVPEGYITVSSGLGRGRPAHLVVIPTEVDGRVNAVLELGFIHAVGESDLDLLSSISQPIAVAVRSARYLARLQELLAETQQQAERLQVQQEELRVSNEELEAQSRALRQSQARLEAQQAELEETNTSLEEQARQLEEQKDDLSAAKVELTRRADELSRANHYKSEFLANMSHELRTPLNSALILARVLADNRDGNLTAEQIRFAETIYSAGNDLLSLISDILDLSRIEAGRLEVKREQVELKRAVDAVTRTFQPVAAKKGLAFTAVVDADTPEAIETDSLRLQQILRNLLSNAFKFTERGEVSLRIGKIEGERLSFAVRDTGVGVPPEQQRIIFEAFRQGDGSTHRRFGGSGLGLSISRELALRLGGEVTLSSEVGRGSTFTLTLPLRPPEEEQLAPGEPLSAPAVAPRRPAPREAPAVEDDRRQLDGGSRIMLIVEDDLRFARILCDLAHELRFRCLVAPTGAEAIALALQHRPSAIVLDINLPDQSGLTVLEQLKRTSSTRHIPVHVVSVADSSQQVLELGAVGFVRKPADRDLLVGALHKLEQKLDQKLRRVLVVEDVPAQRESIVHLLSAEAVEIVAVSSGTEAMERLGQSTFDCMVLDLSLPDMSGYQLLDRMSTDERCAFPPVIVYTARTLGADEEHKLRRYARSIIIKGARSPERLLDEVTLFLHQVEAKLPLEQQRILREVRNRDAAFEGRRILLCEDDVRNVFAISTVLEPRGAKLLIARNGREALEVLDRAALDGNGDGGRGVDLVLMDIMMPEMDGLTATREIRKRPEWKKLPIIALTAKAMRDDREKCLEAGASDYIAKPLDVEKLLSLVKVWLPK